MDNPIYATVVIGGTSGTIVVRPVGTGANIQFTVNAIAGPDYAEGDQVLVIPVAAPGALPCVVGILQ